MFIILILLIYSNIPIFLLKLSLFHCSCSFLSFSNSEKVIKPQQALKVLNDKIKNKDFYITTEVGHHQMWGAQFISFNKHNRWMTYGGLGTMGYGFPASIGVQIANPKSLVICVAGEASFLMNLQELSTVKQYNLPVKVFIMNNR